MCFSHNTWSKCLFLKKRIKNVFKVAKNEIGLKGVISI